MSHGDERLNCWIAPGFDVKRRFEDMKQQVNGSGGAIDQSYLYFDHQSGLEWCQVANAQGFLVAGGLSSDLIHWIADSILLHWKGSEPNPQRMELISLGSGEAHAEIQLVGTLLNKQPPPIKLYLLDTSNMLLRIGYKNATDFLARKKGLSIIAVEGDFYELHQMSPLFDFYEQENRPLRIGCMLGFTFGNLPAELYFIQDSLSAFRPGDLFILDATLTYASAEHPDEVLKMDPRFSDYSWKETYEHWIRGPLDRYRRGIQQIEFRSSFDKRSCQIPGSYSVIVQANVDKHAQFTLMRIRRYDINELIRAFQALGWKSLGGKFFGDRNKRAVCIFEKM